MRKIRNSNNLDLYYWTVENPFMGKIRKNNILDLFYWTVENPFMGKIRKSNILDLYYWTVENPFMGNLPSTLLKVLNAITQVLFILVLIVRDVSCTYSSILKSLLSCACFRAGNKVLCFLISRQE